MAGTEITTPQTFQEKMFERIKESMGDLISDEELKALLDRGVHKAFFEERMVPRKDGWSGSEKAPPYIVGVVEALLKPRVDAFIAAYVEANPDIVKEAFEKALAKGFLVTAMGYFDQQMNYPLQQLTEQLRRNGLPV